MTGLLLVSVAMTASDVIVQWDFTTGKTASTDGNFKGHLRGATRISKDAKNKSMLTIGLGNKGEGIIFSARERDLLDSKLKGGFRVDALVQVREQTTKGNSMVLFDCNYIMNPRITRVNATGGFVMMLHRTRDEKLRPAAMFGHGNCLDTAYGSVFEIPEYTNFTYSMEYDGVKTVRFYINGKLNRETKVKVGGPLGKLYYGPSLGDRIGSGYNRFDGSILKLTIKKLPKK